MTKRYSNKIINKCFVICIVRVINKKRLKRVFKRYISNNIKLLRSLDINHKMFYDNGNFKEIKGSCLTLEVKKRFLEYFCRNNLFEVFYIVSNNRKVKEYFYDNTARSFNYLLKLCFEYYSRKNKILPCYNYLYIDERNVRTETRSTLEEYLNTELVTASHAQLGFKVEYCQSEARELIQIADVFANIYYSNLITINSFSDCLKKIRKDGYIAGEFMFPINK